MFTTIKIKKSDKDLLEKKKKELQLVSVSAVVEKLVKYIDKVK